MKTLKSLLISLILLLSLHSISTAEYFADIIIAGTKGNWTDSRAFTTINDAVTAIGSNERTLVISSPQSVTTLTIPSNITLQFEKDGSINNSGQLTINTTNIIAPNRQIFTGVGDIDFASGSIIKTGWFSNIESAFALTADDTITLIVSKPQTITASYSPGNNVHLKWESPGNILTVNAGVTVDNINQIDAGNYQLFAGAGNFRFLDGTSINLDWFSNLRAAITYASTNKLTILVQGTHTVDYSDTVPSTLSIKMNQGGTFAISTGITLTINGPFEAGLYQVFDCVGTGSVDGLKYANVIWFGPTLDYITDNTSIVQLAINSISSDGVVYIPTDCKYTIKTQSHVLESTRMYRCLVSHTSGVFATDLADGKWELADDVVYTSGGIPWVTGTAYTIANAGGVVFKNNVVVFDHSLVSYPKIIGTGNYGGAGNEIIYNAGYNPAVVLDVNSNYPLEDLIATNGRGNRASFGVRVNGIGQWQFSNDVQNNGSNDFAIIALDSYRPMMLLCSDGRIRYGYRPGLGYDKAFSAPSYSHTFEGNMAIQSDTGSSISFIMRIMDAEDASIHDSRTIQLYASTGELLINDSAGSPIFGLTNGGALTRLKTTNGPTGTLTLDNSGGTTTTVSNTAVTTSSKIILQSTSANAAAAVGSAAGVYISAKNAGESFVVTHPASPGASATMDYWLVN